GCVPQPWSQNERPPVAKEFGAQKGRRRTVDWFAEAKENAGLRLLFRRRTCRRSRQHETAPRGKRSKSSRDDTDWFACSSGVHNHDGGLQLFLRSQAHLSAPIERATGSRSCQG